MCVGLQEEANVRVPDSLTEHLRADNGVERARGVRVTQIMEGDPREPRGRGEAVETLPDGVRVSWAPVLEGEHVVAGVIIGAEELALAVLTLAPSAQRRDGGPIDRYRLVGILGFATGFVPGASDDDPVVMHSDLAGIEVDGRSLESATTNLAPSDPGRQFKQEERCEPVALHRHQEGLDLVGPPHHAPFPRAFGWFDVAGRVVGDVLPRNGIMAKIESKHDVRRKVREAQAQANRERLETESDNREDMVAFLVAQQKLTAVDEWESDRHEQVRLEADRRREEQRPRVLARWRGCVIAGSPWPALRRSAGAARKSCAATSKNCAPRCRDRLPTAGTVRKHYGASDGDGSEALGGPERGDVGARAASPTVSLAGRAAAGSAGDVAM